MDFCITDPGMKHPRKVIKDPNNLGILRKAIKNPSKILKGPQEFLKIPKHSQESLNDPKNKTKISLKNPKGSLKMIKDPRELPGMT